jgi:hypothetical protein
MRNSQNRLSITGSLKFPRSTPDRKGNRKSFLLLFLKKEAFFVLTPNNPELLNDFLAHHTANATLRAERFRAFSAGKSRLA